LTKFGDVDSEPGRDTVDGWAKLRMKGRGSGPAVKVKMLAVAEARLASGRKS